MLEIFQPAEILLHHFLGGYYAFNNSGCFQAIVGKAANQWAALLYSTIEFMLHLYNLILQIHQKEVLFINILILLFCITVFVTNAVN